MQRVMLKSKIHRATVTEADLHYVGSITLDPVLLEASDIQPFERVAVADINNGNRFETYAMEGERGSGQVVLNGAAARLASPGDLVIVFSFGWYEDSELEGYKPRVILVDEKNRPVDSL